jgi:hypothetical protein
MEESIIKYYNTLSPLNKKKVRALLEARVILRQGKDTEALTHIRDAKISHKELLEFHKQTWDYVFDILPAETILSKLQ